MKLDFEVPVDRLPAHDAGPRRGVVRHVNVIQSPLLVACGRDVVRDVSTGVRKC